MAGIRLAAACSSSARWAAAPLWNPSEPTCPPWAVASCQGLGWRASSCLASSTLRVLRSACPGVTFFFALAVFFAVFLVAFLVVFSAVFFDTVFFEAFFTAFLVAFFATFLTAFFVAFFATGLADFAASFSIFFASFSRVSKRLRMSAMTSALSLLRWLAAPLVPRLLPVLAREDSF